MQARLKLVSHHGKKVGSHSRPIVTDYVGLACPSREARSCTVHSAINAATRRILKKDFKSAAIYNNIGQLVIVIKRVSRGGIMIFPMKRGYL